MSSDTCRITLIGDKMASLLLEVLRRIYCNAASTSVLVGVDGEDEPLKVVVCVGCIMEAAGYMQVSLELCLGS